MNWILCGFKGCGKSHFGAKLSLPFLDLDQLIEEKERSSIPKIIQRHGESYFRQVEREMVLSLKVNNHVIALGGGTVLDKENISYLKTQGIIIYLKYPKLLLKKRLLTPPLPTFLCDEADFERMYAQRIPIYETIANYTIDLEKQTEQETLEALWQVISLATSSGSPPGENLMAKPLVL